VFSCLLQRLQSKKPDKNQNKAMKITENLKVMDSLEVIRLGIKEDC
jgi:hypothetical protein